MEKQMEIIIAILNHCDSKTWLSTTIFKGPMTLPVICDLLDTKKYFRARHNYKNVYSLYKCRVSYKISYIYDLSDLESTLLMLYLRIYTSYIHVFQDCGNLCSLKKTNNLNKIGLILVLGCFSCSFSHFKEIIHLKMKEKKTTDFIHSLLKDN